MRLVTNARVQGALRGTPLEIDFRPVIRLSVPGTGGVWLLAELDPIDWDTAYGLIDFGLGPELGSVSLRELLEVSGPTGMPLQVDELPEPILPLRRYLASLSAAGTEDSDAA